MRTIWVALIWFCLALPVAAQSLVPDALVSTTIGTVDTTGWDGVATRAEALTESDTASRFALTHIRAELVNWRDRFSAALDINANRLETVASQIAALGDTTGAGPVIVARAQELTALQDRLLQPQLLAQEAFARANGLITEIDRRQRAMETERLTTRGASPANPANWPEAILAAQTGMAALGTEIWGIGAAHFQNGSLWSRLVLGLIGLGGAWFLLTRARIAIASTASDTFLVGGRAAAGAKFAVSVASVALPVIGLILVVIVLRLSGLFGVSSQAVLATLPYAGGLVFGARLLADFYFPLGKNDDGILGYPKSVRTAARPITIWLGWALALVIVMSAFLDTADATAVSRDVLNLPLQLLVGVLLWRLGRLIAQPARTETEALFVRSKLRVFIGRAGQVFAVAGPLASVLGYGAAAAAITIPAVTSLAIIAIIVVLQQLSYAVASRSMSVDQPTDDAADRFGLLPISINFGLILLGLPALALVWGVSGAELYELWTRFLAGFSVGDTQISPSNFLTFILVFMAGVLITRFIKATLKTTVMPRTKFDLGGQNAVVAGFGYVGIFLSALIAFGVAGIDLSSLAIVAGALSVGIGFGLQNIVSNFVSGIILLIERPVGEGDMIEVGGKMGYVRDISVRSTRIETFDRTDVIIPNADLVSNQVTNWTRGSLVGRAILPVGVAYGTDTEQVTAILKEVAEAHPLVLLNPPPSVLLIGFGADSIDFEIRAIIRDVNFALSAKSEMFHSIVARFDEAGIEIPFAQRDLWLRNPEVLNPKGEGA